MHARTLRTWTSLLLTILIGLIPSSNAMALETDGAPSVVIHGTGPVVKDVDNDDGERSEESLQYANSKLPQQNP
ncbi:hypothetical protein MJO28_015557 [Puccinia striiformis f. sp. tritici]|uniref:Uncharacterized protein n=3 Tax=Puccinia striiformis TaxID=27350 RepID=A0A0L0VI02_9BASI|nr:hypothetical protein Pst134EA_029427 [Puccinia striiformis f. sp. tritici]KAI9614383.1 hypothetical protein H4Q26_009533 [Puccinia striiformis f. sp. tritici PST-130]KNE98915.1 hypothetical protein PSTG_07760 [Puccinia striiformis f. sp. tritici PST-78]POV96368.1 hypothetical protein PSTT_15680 [Puccinia striiformis]KAH9441417.1 hypothetical protein Pst134EB_030082 [Puccinia striiformis f. sp. tritici]KAH9447387.1 hypothetical protein Pst134EA_029427 [Puccinia striiformis f. sp. tritici]